MATQNASSAGILPDLADMFPSLNKFIEHCAGLAVALQNELDAMLGFSLQNDPYALMCMNEHQHDPHLFFRICFFLVKVSYPALQSWVDIQRLGFASYMMHQTPEMNVVDVATFQARPPGYSIVMQLRLLDGATILEPPEWLTEKPLPIPWTFDLIPDFQYPSSIQDDLPVFQETAAGGSSDPLNATPPFVGPATPLNKSQDLVSDILSLALKFPDNGLGSRPQSFRSDLESSAPDTRGSFHPSGSGKTEPGHPAPLSRTPTLQNLDKPSAPLSRTPTIQNLNKPSWFSSQSQLNRSASLNSGLSRVPTILNIMPPNPTKSSGSLVRSSSVRSTASFIRSGGGGLQRSDTVSTIRESDEHPAAAGVPQNRLGSNLSRDSGWGIQSSQDEPRRLRDDSDEESRVPCLASLVPLTSSEEALMDPVSGDQLNQTATPQAQDVSAMGMDVDSK